MKTNYIYLLFIVLLSMCNANLYAKVNKSTEVYTVTFQTERPEELKITLLNTQEILDLSTQLVYQMESGSAFMIEGAQESVIIESVEINGNLKNPSGDGKYRWGVSNEDLTVKIKTKSNANPVVTFNTTDPSHLAVWIDDEVVDITNPVTVNKGSLLTVSAASDNYQIESVLIDGRNANSSGDGKYRTYVNGDMIVDVRSKSLAPTIRFNVDFVNRINVWDASNDVKLDISQPVQLPVGTPLTIEPSDDKYSIISVEQDGRLLSLSGDSKYHTGVTGEMTLTIKTASTEPTVTIKVDRPECVRVAIQGDETGLDLSKPHELQKGTQLVIESISEEYTIMSVTINNFKLLPSDDGKYYTSVSADLDIDIKTKGNLPVLQFKVDAPERVLVTADDAEVDFSIPVEKQKGTNFAIMPKAENFQILSVKAGDKMLAAEANGKYQFVLQEDMDVVIKTLATLGLNIIQNEQGIVQVRKDGVELQSGTTVKSGDTLLLNHVSNNGYAFDCYTINGSDYSEEKYVVKGSTDITIGAKYRVLQPNRAIVKFDIDRPLFITVYYAAKNVDVTKELEVGKDEEINVFVTGAMAINNCSANGVLQDPQADNENSYKIVIKENTVIKITTEQLVYVSGERTTDQAYNTIGNVWVGYKGETVYRAKVRVGETVDLVPEPAQGYSFDHFIRNLNEDDHYTSDKYTVTQEDLDNGGIVSFKGVFVLSTGLTDLSAPISYYDEQSSTIVNAGGPCSVYTISGEKLFVSDNRYISLSGYQKGVYIVKSQDRIFKIIKK